MGEPATRVGTMRDFLDLLERKRPGSKPLILERFDPESREILDSRLGFSWLSIAHGHFAVEGIFDLLGPDEGVRFFREGFRNIVDRPIFRSFISGILSLWGSDPGRIFRQLPRGWELGFRDFCRVQTEDPEPGRIRVVFEDIHPEVRQHPAYLSCWHGICQGMADLVEKDVQLDFEVAPDHSRAVATFRWRP